MLVHRCLKKGRNIFAITVLLCSLKEFLPQSYVKVKGIEKKVFAEHKKHVGLSELDAKVLYTKTARSLKTYGVTFFLVKVMYKETDDNWGEGRM
jgi:hypothetical protein